MGNFYRAVVQAVLLYGSETWTISDRIRTLIDSFHHKCARYIVREFIYPREDGEWHVPATEEVLSKCGLKRIDEHIKKRREGLEKYLSQRLAANPNQIVWWKNR